METNNDFTNGPIIKQLLKFMLPVLLAMFLQAMYGAIDLLVVGNFASNADVSAVSTGSQIVLTLTNIIVSFSMGITVVVGQRIGERNYEAASKTIGSSITFFLVIGILFTLLSTLGASILASIMNAPKEAFTITEDYIRICGFGFIIITAYNILGSIFRGIGDSTTPLIAVGIACVFNIIGDLIFVAVFKLGASGAAYATVLAQLISVLVSLIIIKNKKLPFAFEKNYLKPVKTYISKVIQIGFPIALQDFLVGISFLVLLAIVNNLGVDASSGVGVAEKVCAFIMLVPGAFMQSMSSFVAQNIGANKVDRARKALFDGILISTIFGVLMFVLTFFRGDLLAGIFSQDNNTIINAYSYLKAYAIDCLLTCFLFCFIGYYNGIGRTTFVMIQGNIGSFCIRIPVAFLMNHFFNGNLFLIGLATPCSTLIQITMCFTYFYIINKKKNNSLWLKIVLLLLLIIICLNILLNIF